MRRCYFSICIVFLVSCSDKNRVPSELIQPKKMQAVLMDILIVDGVNSIKAGSTQGLNITDLNSKTLAQVLKNYNISYTVFSKSNNYYLAHPDIMKPIADSISAIASRQVNNAYSDTSNRNNGSNIKDLKRKFRN